MGERVSCRNERKERGGRVNVREEKEEGKGGNKKEKGGKKSKRSDI